MGLCANRSIRFYYIITIHDILVRISRRPSRLFVPRNTDSCWCKLLFYLVTCPIDFQINWWFIKKPLNKFRGVFSLLGDENLSIYKLSNLFHYITSIPDGLISINLFFLENLGDIMNTNQLGQRRQNILLLCFGPSSQNVLCLFQATVSFKQKDDSMLT